VSVRFFFGKASPTTSLPVRLSGLRVHIAGASPGTLAVRDGKGGEVAFLKKPHRSNGRKRGTRTCQPCRGGITYVLCATQSNAYATSRQCGVDFGARRHARLRGVAGRGTNDVPAAHPGLLAEPLSQRVEKSRWQADPWDHLLYQCAGGEHSP